MNARALAMLLLAAVVAAVCALLTSATTRAEESLAALPREPRERAQEQEPVELAPDRAAGGRRAAAAGRDPRTERLAQEIDPPGPRLRRRAVKICVQDSAGNPLHATLCYRPSSDPSARWAWKWTEDGTARLITLGAPLDLEVKAAGYRRCTLRGIQGEQLVVLERASAEELERALAELKARLEQAPGPGVYVIF